LLILTSTERKFEMATPTPVDKNQPAKAPMDKPPANNKSAPIGGVPKKPSDTGGVVG
jgi:hypothetical protein